MMSLSEWCHARRLALERMMRSRRFRRSLASLQREAESLHRTISMIEGRNDEVSRRV